MEYTTKEHPLIARMREVVDNRDLEERHRLAVAGAINLIENAGGVERLVDDQTHAKAEIDWEEVRLMAARFESLSGRLGEEATREVARLAVGSRIGSARTSDPHPILKVKVAERLEGAARAMLSAAIQVAVSLDDGAADEATEGDWSAGGIEDGPDTD